MGVSDIPTTVYSLNKTVNEKFNAEKHYLTKKICSKCKAEIIEDCLICNVPMTSKYHPITITTFRMQKQLINIVTRNIASLLDYRKHLSQNTGDDVLNSNYFNLKFSEPNLTIHLLLSVDGGSFFSTVSDTIWPLQAVILDLPPWVRQSFKNALLLALWKGPSKPMWNVLLKDLIEILSNCTFKVMFRDTEWIFTVKVALCVCDLPAIASLTNTVQYNGKFGCLKCVHPGETLKQGKGHSHIYSYRISQLKTNAFYERCLAATRHSQTPVFGVRGPSSLSHIINIPDQIILDPMHMIYEGVTKLFLKAYFDSKNMHLPFYVGRPRVVQQLSKQLLLISFLPKMTDCRAFTELNFWKASEYKNFLLFAIPILKSKLPAPYFVHILTLSLICHISNQRSVDAFDVENLANLISFFCTETERLFGQKFCTINVHSLTHLTEQIKSFGPCWSYSMFFFEGQIKRFKNMFSGTRGILDQIAKSYVLLNEINHAMAGTLDSSHNLLFDKSCKGQKYHTYASRPAWSYVKINNTYGVLTGVNQDQKRATFHVYDSAPVALNVENSLLPPRFLDITLRYFAVIRPTQSFSTVSLEAITARCVCLPIGNDIYVSVIPNTFEHN